MFRPEDYVTHDVGLLLKEMGFSEPVHSQYTNTGTAWVCQEPENFNESVDCCCSRPTLYEAQRWLREKLHIFLTIIEYEPFSVRYGYSSEIMYRCKIYQYKEGVGCKSFEKALNEGIRELCKLIKERRL